jgi:hypothetical protein
MINYYIEEDGVPKKVDVDTWVKWIAGNPKREVKRTFFEKEKVEIVTVFFGLPEVDLEFDPKGEKPPKTIEYLYGTMVFGGRLNHQEETYCLRKEAEDGHEKIVAKVKADLASS